MFNLMAVIDRFLHPNLLKDRESIIQNRTTVSINLVAIVVFIILISVQKDPLGILFYSGLPMLFVSLLILKYTEYTIISMFVVIGFLQAINIDFFASDFATRGMMNIQILWAMTFLVASPLVGGFRLGFFSLSLVLVFFNYIALTGMDSLPSLELRRISEAYLIEFNLVTVLISGGTFLFKFFLIDQIRKTNQANEKLKKQREKSLHAAKFAALGEMAGGIAHEINNPLAIISGYAGNIKTILGSDNLENQRKRLLDRLDKIDATVYRISKIINTMRKLSRDKSNEEWQNHDFRSIIDEVCTLLFEKVKSRGYHLRLNVPSDTFIYCDPIAIGQVLINLLNNAFDALEEYSLPDGWIEIGFAEDPAGFYRFKVSNSGPKIPQELAEKIMNPFFTTKEIGTSTGLGLSVSRNIATLHHGKLDLDMNSEHTCFVLSLPKGTPAHTKNLTCSKAS